MSEHNRITDLREEWEQLPSEQLEMILHEELDKITPDDDVVLQILHILEARELDEPVKLTSREKDAYLKYRDRVRSRHRKAVNVRLWISIAASLVLIVTLFFTILPQQAEAETFCIPSSLV